MDDRRDQVPAAARDLAMDMAAVRGQLAEIETMWRRRCAAEGPWQAMPRGFPHTSQDAADRLVSTLQELADTGPDRIPGLAASAVRQFAALDAGVRAPVAAAGETGGNAVSAALLGTMSRAGSRLEALASRLERPRLERPRLERPRLERQG